MESWRLTLDRGHLAKRLSLVSANPPATQASMACVQLMKSLRTIVATGHGPGKHCVLLLVFYQAVCLGLTLPQVSDAWCMAHGTHFLVLGVQTAVGSGAQLDSGVSQGEAQDVLCEAPCRGRSCPSPGRRL